MGCVQSAKQYQQQKQKETPFDDIEVSIDPLTDKLEAKPSETMPQQTAEAAKAEDSVLFTPVLPPDKQSGAAQFDERAGKNNVQSEEVGRERAKVRMSKLLPLLIQDTTDADNQIALSGLAKDVFDKLDDIDSVKGIFGVCPRHVDLSFPLAFNKHIVKSRPDFRSFELVKNAHEGSGLVAQADYDAGMNNAAEVQEDTELVARNEVRRTYTVLMRSIGLDPGKKDSWDFIQRAFPSFVLPVCKEHLLSHHYHAREYLFDRGDLEGACFGDPLSAKCYNSIIAEIDGDVAANEKKAYDRCKDVETGLADARRQRARKIIQQALDEWDKVLKSDHRSWLKDCDHISQAHMAYVTDAVIMAPCTLTMGHWSSLKSCKRVWGMFFALDNAAEYGHWIMEEKAKNIFRNNFNTALDEEGTLRMLKFIQHKEVTAYFHPTELFKSEAGQKTWEVARTAVEPVKEQLSQGDKDVPPLLAVYQCYNAAKSPDATPQQLSDPMIVFEFLNFAANFQKTTSVIETSDDKDEYLCMMPVASYSPATIQADMEATAKNYEVAVNGAKAEGFGLDRISKLVRKEQVFVVKPSYEPLNNGVYVGMNLVNRMVPVYSLWLKELLLSKPKLSTPQEMSAVLPIMDVPLKVMKRGPLCGPGVGLCCGA